MIVINNSAIQNTFYKIHRLNDYDFRKEKPLHRETNSQCNGHNPLTIKNILYRFKDCQHNIIEYLIIFIILILLILEKLHPTFYAMLKHIQQISNFTNSEVISIV